MMNLLVYGLILLAIGAGVYALLTGYSTDPGANDPVDRCKYKGLRYCYLNGHKRRRRRSKSHRQLFCKTDMHGACSHKLAAFQ